MRKLLKDKTGSVPVLTFGFVFVLLILTFLTIEMGSTYENYDYHSALPWRVFLQHLKGC